MILNSLSMVILRIQPLQETCKNYRALPMGSSNKSPSLLIEQTFQLLSKIFANLLIALHIHFDANDAM